MMVFKSKQIVVLALVLMVVVAGYLQYSYKKNAISTEANGEEKLGEAAYVEADDTSATQSDSGTSKKAGNDVSVSKQTGDFFAQAKLDRDQARSRDTETLKTITEDSNAGKETKAEAFEKMMKLVDNSQREMNIELLVKEIGFDDVLVLFGEDGSLDIRVKSSELTSSQVAQISDIASRQAKIDMDKIFIKYVQ